MKMKRFLFKKKHCFPQFRKKVKNIFLKKSDGKHKNQTLKKIMLKKMRKNIFRSRTGMMITGMRLLKRSLSSMEIRYSPATVFYPSSQMKRWKI